MPDSSKTSESALARSLWHRYAEAPGLIRTAPFLRVFERTEKMSRMPLLSIANRWMPTDGSGVSPVWRTLQRPVTTAAGSHGTIARFPAPLDIQEPPGFPPDTGEPDQAFQQTYPAAPQAQAEDDEDTSPVQLSAAPALERARAQVRGPIQLMPGVSLKDLPSGSIPVGRQSTPPALRTSVESIQASPAAFGPGIGAASLPLEARSPLIQRQAASDPETPANSDDDGTAGEVQTAPLLMRVQTTTPGIYQQPAIDANQAAPSPAPLHSTVRQLSYSRMETPFLQRAAEPDAPEDGQPQASPAPQNTTPQFLVRPDADRPAGSSPLPFRTPRLTLAPALQRAPDESSDTRSGSSFANPSTPAAIAEQAIPAPPPPGSELDVSQVADQVYDLLVQRLSSERDRRGF